MHRAIVWALLAGAWLLLVVSLVSYDPADHPTHAYGVPNAQGQNWAGVVGAVIAHKAYLVLGPGVWVALAGITVLLALLAMGRSVDQMVLRAVGLVIMTITTSTLVAVVLPGLATGGPPEGPGGLMALFLSDQLISRFAVLGTFLIVLVGFWVGAILTADRWVMTVPVAIGGSAVRLANAGMDRPWTRVREGRFLGWFGRRGAGRPAAGAGRRTRGAGQDRGSSGRRRDDADAIDEGAGGFAATRPFDPAQQTRDDEADEQDGEDEPVDRTRFTPDELRAKIKKLPINFSTPVVRSGQAGPPREPDFSGYEFPSLRLLEEPESNFTKQMEQIVRDQAMGLESALQEYRIQGEVVGIDSGPVITLFELRLAPGTKVAKIGSVASDLARALRAQNIRIVPNMAGKDTVGVEVPNQKKERVRLKELLSAENDYTAKMKLPMFLGKDASGNPLVQDLGDCPHMLIAGTTGSGKSVCINAIIMSFLYTKHPDDLKLVLVDPKMVEMSMFKEIPHLMCPVVTEMTKATAILEWAVTKMDERYELLAEAGVRDVDGYNGLGWEQIKERIGPADEQEEARIPRKLPYMVFVIDELADMIITNKEVEGSIVRISQKARAVGIHLILATQRPQANVVTGLIKSNMPCRIGFKVASGMDSRIVLDQKGGELLLGQGDMLFLSPRSSKLTRAQGTLVDDSEIRQTVRFLSGVSQPSFEPQLVQIKSLSALESDEQRDPLFDDAVQIVLESQRGSVSLLQRRLTIGYSRASRLIEQMGAAGIIGEYKGSQAREVLIGADEWEAMKAQAEADALAGSADGYGDQPEADEENEDEQDADGQEQVMEDAAAAAAEEDSDDEGDDDLDDEKDSDEDEEEEEEDAEYEPDKEDDQP